MYPTLALPFVLLSRRQGVAADTATAVGTPAALRLDAGRGGATPRPCGGITASARPARMTIPPASSAGVGCSPRASQVEASPATGASRLNGATSETE